MDKDLNLPKVSVFMAAFNAAKFIESAIKSVLDQSFKDFELIIVNDGSTDQTIQVIDRFHDKRINVFSNERNMGLTYTRNRLRELARAPFIAILDSDDIAHPDRLALQYNFLIANPSFALCGGQAREIDLEGNFTGKIMRAPVNKNGIASKTLFDNPFINSSMMFRTDTFMETEGYRDYAPAEDYDLFVRMCDQKKAYNLDEVLVDYRVHPTNTSKTNAEQLVFNEKRIIAHMLSSLGVPISEENLALHYEIFSRRVHQINLKKYYQLFLEIKKANQITKKYDETDLNITLHKMWSEDILMSRSIKGNALSMLFWPQIFHPKSLTFKQLRKAFKKSLKTIF